MYTFKGWYIETRSNANLNVICDKNDNHFVVFDEDKDPVVWIRPSENGDGIAIDKMGWGASVDLLHEDKKIIITYSGLDDDEEED